MDINRESRPFHTQFATTMFTHHLRLLFILLFLINYIGKGLTLQCYMCKSVSNGPCGDPFNKSLLTTSVCPFPEYMCLKQKQVVKLNGKEAIEVNRNCVPSSYCRVMLFDHCSVCDTDYCNSSNINLATLTCLLILQLCLNRFF